MNREKHEMSSTSDPRRAPKAPPPMPQEPQGATAIHPLPPLPYAEDALEPVISRRTVALHHGKHQRGYIDTVNRLVAETPFASLTLLQIVRATAGRPEHVALYNSAAQAWNHDFYWRSLRPHAAPPASAMLQAQIEASFGSLDALIGALGTAASAQFGSGWVWLVTDGGRLKVVTTGNADNPILRDLWPLLTIDVWEHAYYLDYQNRRADYLAAVLAQLINWEFAAANLARG